MKSQTITIDIEDVEKNMELKKFRKLVKSEINQAQKSYEQAKKAYETVMKQFVIREISGKKEFKRYFDSTYEILCEDLSYECGSLIVNDLITLERIISDHDYWLEDGRFDEEDEEIE